MRSSFSVLPLCLTCALAAGLLLASCDSGGGIPDELGSNTTFSFETLRATVAEDSVDTVTLTVVVDDPGYKELSVNLTFDAAQSTASAEDFTGLPTDTTFTFPKSTTSGDTRSVTFSIVSDDIRGEGSERAVFTLTNPAGGDVGEVGTFTLVVNDNAEVVSISEARERGGGATVTVEGIVTRSMGAYTYIQDESGPTGASGLTIRQTEGDFFDDVQSGAIQPGTRIQVAGTLSYFSGLLQINGDALVGYTILSQDNPLPEPQTVDLADLANGGGEQYEAELITVDNLTTDATGTFEAGTSYNASDGTATGTLRIPNPSDTAVDGTPIPSGTFTFTGVLGQFNFGGGGADEPDEGYQLLAIREGDVEATGGGGGEAETLLSEGFQDGDGTRGLGAFTPYSVSSDTNWVRATFNGSTFYAYINAFEASEAANDWLISPALDFGSYTGETLTFESDKRYDGPDLKVLVSTDYDGSGNPENFTWTNITSRVNLDTDSGSFGFAPSGAVDVSDFSGSEVYIAFQYVSEVGNAATWELDDIKVTGQPQ